MEGTLLRLMLTGIIQEQMLFCVFEFLANRKAPRYKFCFKPVKFILNLYAVKLVLKLYVFTKIFFYISLGRFTFITNIEGCSRIEFEPNIPEIIAFRQL